MIRVSYYSLIRVISRFFIIYYMLIVEFFWIKLYFTLLYGILIHRALHDTLSTTHLFWDEPFFPIFSKKKPVHTFLWSRCLQFCGFAGYNLWST